jgi:hypothetical protein
VNADEKGRVFAVTSGSSVEIYGLTITGGKARNAEPGGGIHNAGALRLNDCVIVNNEGTKFGGGIFNTGALQVSNTSITQNSTRFKDFQSWGAGIYNSAGASLEISDSVIADNNLIPCYSCRAIGAGIANLGSAIVLRTSISRNVAHPSGVATIGGFGGGIYNEGYAKVDSSLINENIATGDWIATGGGIANGFEYGVGGTLEVINSTIAENHALTNGGDPVDNPTGGGISADFGGSVSVRHSTIARNWSFGGMPGFGGGISITNTTFTLKNSILAENVSDTGLDISGNLESSGFNLIQSSAGGSGFHPSDILNVSAMLAPLADNGGPTQTMALLPGSFAIDAGDNTDAPEWDQRGPGFPRIVNDTIDIGAYEVQAIGVPRLPDILPLLIATDFQNDEEGFVEHAFLIDQKIREMCGSRSVIPGALSRA